MNTKIIVILALIASMGDAYGMGRLGSLARRTAQVLLRPAVAATSFVAKQPVNPIFTQSAHHFSTWSARSGYDIAKHYHALGVPKSASLEEVFIAHRKLMKKWHPDLHEGDLTEVTAKTQEINAAREAIFKHLKNKQKAASDAAQAKQKAAEQQASQKADKEENKSSQTGQSKASDSSGAQQAKQKTAEQQTSQKADREENKGSQAESAQASAQAPKSHHSPLVGNGRDKRNLFFGSVLLAALSQWLMKREDEKQLVLHDDLMKAVKETDLDALSVAIGAGVNVNKKISEEVMSIDVVLKEIEQKEFARQKGVQETVKQMAAALEVAKAQECVRRNCAEQAAQERILAELALRKKEDADPATSKKMNEKYAYETPRPFKISLRRLYANVKASVYAVGEFVYATGASVHALCEQTKGVAFDAYGKAQTAAFGVGDSFIRFLTPLKVFTKHTTALDTVNSMLEKQLAVLHTKKKLLHEKNKKDALTYQTLQYQLAKQFSERKAKEWSGLTEDTLLEEVEQVQKLVEKITAMKDRLLAAGAETAEALQQDHDAAIAAERMGL